MTLKSFSDIFSRAKQQDEYWVADAIYTFAEEYHKLFVSEDISKAELAKRTRTSPAYISKVFRGDANFTIRTMVRLVRALGGKLNLHISRADEEVGWLYICDKERNFPDWHQRDYVPVFSQLQNESMSYEHTNQS